MSDLKDLQRPTSEIASRSPQSFCSVKITILLESWRDPMDSAIKERTQADLKS